MIEYRDFKYIEDREHRIKVIREIIEDGFIEYIKPEHLKWFNNQSHY